MVTMGVHNFLYLIAPLKHFSFPPYKDTVWTLQILEVCGRRLWGGFECWKRCLRLYIQEAKEQISFFLV